MSSVNLIAAASINPDGTFRSPGGFASSVRVSAGVYDLGLPWAIGVDEGCPMVTPISATPCYGVAEVRPDGLSIRVRMFDVNGLPVDAAFSVGVLRVV